MENMDKSQVTVSKSALINLLKIHQMPQHLSAQIVFPSPIVWNFDEKKASLGVCSPCSRQNSQDQRTSFLADTGKKNFHLLFLLSCSYRKSFFTANALTLPVRCFLFKRAIKILLACFTCGGWSTKLPVTTKVYRKTKDTLLLKAKR